jgi:N-acetylglucosamine transport system substrate-binding protein
MTGAPVPTPSSSPKMPYEALHSGGGEPFIVPSQAKNKAGGKEILRIMLSKDAAANFAKTKLAPTVVKDTVPADGFGSTALVSQTKMLDAAGKNVFNWQFLDLYGMNKDVLVVWNAFLDGKSNAAKLAEDMQKMSDKIRNDSSIKKVEIK